MQPPKPAARAEGRVSLWRYVRLFRQDILSAQPARLYRAWMAEFRTPFFTSYMVNDPKLKDEVLSVRPLDFPKSSRVAEGLRPLLGQSVFLTNGALWQRQRRIIDPAFEGGRLRDTFAAMVAAGQAAAARIDMKIGAEPVEIEEEMSHAAADVIFRTLFSIPITHHVAAQVFTQFRAYQRTQPILNLAAFLPLPRWLPRFHRPATRRTAAAIRRLITDLTAERMAAIRAGTAPDDLATKIMTTADPQTGQTFSTAEMVDQVAIFFLAGHETSASALGWALWLLAAFPEAQDRVAAEAAGLSETPAFSELSRLKFTRDVFREALRLYPPVPMMVREATRPETFRDRAVPQRRAGGAQPWHLHRHERLWERPDDFDPDRYATENGRACLRDAYMPFSPGARVCTGAGFAMIEGPLLLAMLVRRVPLRIDPGDVPVPVAYLTVRAQRRHLAAGQPALSAAWRTVSTVTSPGSTVNSTRQRSRRPNTSICTGWPSASVSGASGQRSGTMARLLTAARNPSSRDPRRRRIAPPAIVGGHTKIGGGTGRHLYPAFPRHVVDRSSKVGPASLTAALIRSMTPARRAASVSTRSIRACAASQVAADNTTRGGWPRTVSGITPPSATPASAAVAFLWRAARLMGRAFCTGDPRILQNER